MKACKYCRENHEPTRGLVFDGIGVNGCDMYRSRIATVTASYRDCGLGPVFAAAPELLDALQRLLGVCELNLDDMESDTHKAIAQAVDAVAKAGAL